MNYLLRTVFARLWIDFLVAALSAPAFAVYLDQGGIGQALLFPYYTVRASHGGTYNTYVSISNTSATSAVVAKVRFREGRNSSLVAEFNLYLAPNDMWS